MEQVILESEVYLIPYKVRCSLTIRRHIAYIVMISMFSAIGFIPIEGVFLKLASILLVIICLYFWIVVGLLRKNTLEFTSDEIIYTYFFSVKRVRWSEILDVQIYTENKNLYIGILFDRPKTKKGFLDSFNPFDISIAKGMFAGADFLRLYVTITKAAKTASLQASDQW